MSASAALALHGELTLDLGAGAGARILCGDERVVLELSDHGSARALLAGMPRELRSGLGAALRAVDLGLELRVRGWRVATLDGRRGSWLARLFGLPGARLDLLGLLLCAFVRERPVRA